MHELKVLALTVVAGFAFTAASTASQAQVVVSVGAAPNCPYGYYEAAPYNCAPYGYYGPEWFTGGVFVGAGQWFRGPSNFQGHVDTNYEPDHGYKGAYPTRGEKPNPEYHVNTNANFKGNQVRDGRGHVSEGGGGGGEEHKH
jgi:hypothetical protein